MKLYLITHAHTQADPAVDGAKWQLSSQGQQQAHLLAAQPWWSEVQHIVVSSEPKTRLTVAPVVAERALPLHEDARFDELYRPGWVAAYSERVEQAFAVPEQPAGDWEPAAGALRRFLTGIEWLRRTFAGETVALAGHGLTFSLYRAHLLGQRYVKLADWRRLSFAAVALADPVAGQLMRDFEPVAGAMRRG